MRPPLPPVAAIAAPLAVVVLLMTATASARAAPTAGGAAPTADGAPPSVAASDAHDGSRPDDRQTGRGGGVRPVPGAVVRPVPGAVVRPFDPPAHPYGPGHRGVDLAAAPGELVRATLEGTVAFSGPVAAIGWVTIDHGGGLVTTYGPLDQRLATGVTVTAGQAIGRLERDLDPPPTHLDWGARLTGDYIDPLLLLGRWQLRLTTVPP